MYQLWIITISYIGSVHVSNGTLQVAVLVVGASASAQRGAGQRSVSSNLAAASPLARNQRFVPAGRGGGAAGPGPFSRK